MAAKAFTESNKENIRNALLQKGKELFIRYGLKKTSVDELTRAVGISKGSFYTFFNSKEALFMAIHEETENLLQTDMIQKLKHLKRSEDILRAFFSSAFRFIEEDPLMQSIFSGGGTDSLSSYMDTDDYKKHYHHDLTFLEDLVKDWQQQGIIRQLDPSVVSTMIASIYYIVLQKNTIGEDMYEKVINMLIDSLVNYLKTEDK